MTPATRAGVILPARTSEPLARPRLVPRSPAQPHRHPLAALPVYWHLLSLDAPTVVILWAWSFARALHTTAPAGEIAVLGIGTWLIYVLDRILDARILKAGPAASIDHLRERHFFHARHRRPLLIACTAAAVPLLWLIAAHMTSAARQADAILFSISLIYFSLVHIAPPRLRRRFPREFAVGVIFALATAVPAWSHSPDQHLALAAPVLLFAALCSLNCLAIESWERPLTAPRHRAVSVLAAWIAAATLLLICAGGNLRLLAAILASALLLLALDCDDRGDLQAGDRAFSALALRITADAALLTPLLFVLASRR